MDVKTENAGVDKKHVDVQIESSNVELKLTTDSSLLTQLKDMEVHASHGTDRC